MSTDILTPARAEELLAAPDTSSNEAKALVPVTMTETALVAYVKPEAREKLVCANLLTDEEKAKAYAEAEEILPELMDNINFLMAYATGSADTLDSLVKRALGEVKDTDPEIEKLMKGVQDEFRGVGTRFDITVPEIRQKFERTSDRFLGFLWKTKTMLQMLYEASQDLSEQTDGMKKKVQIKAESAMDDANLFVVLHKANEGAIDNFVYGIAVLEYARALVLKEYESITADGSDPSQHDLNQRKLLLGRLMGSLNIRIGDFQARLLDAYAASAEFSDWVQANFDLALKLDFLWRVALPNINQTLLTWQKNVDARQKAKTISTVTDFYNTTKQMGARASAEGIREVEMAAQSPIMLAETMAVIVQAAETRANNVREAAKLGSDSRLKFAEDALTAINRVETTQAQLHQDLATQAALEAAALKAHQAVSLLEIS